MALSLGKKIGFSVWAGLLALGVLELGLRGFLHVVNDSRLVGLPMVLETPKPAVHADAINLAILRALAGRQRVGKRARQLAEQPFDEAPPA